jgi:hypothetical protein
VPPPTTDDEESDEEDSFQPNSDGIFHSLSQNVDITLKIWDRDKVLAAQQKLQEKLAKTTEYALANISQVHRETLNLSMGGDPETLELVMQLEKEVLSKTRQFWAEKDLEESGGVKHKLASFPETGKKSSKRKRENRKQSSTNPGVLYGSHSQL